MGWSSKKITHKLTVRRRVAPLCWWHCSGDWLCFQFTRTVSICAFPLWSWFAIHTHTHKNACLRASRAIIVPKCCLNDAIVIDCVCLVCTICLIDWSKCEARHDGDRSNVCGCLSVCFNFLNECTNGFEDAKNCGLISGKESGFFLYLSL